MNDVTRDAVDGLTPLDEFTLADLESIRLILRGDSVIDWRRLDFAHERDVQTFLAAHELHPDDPSDRMRLDHVKAEAVAYLRRQFDYPIPRPVERASVPELLLLAAGRGHRAMCACTILKCMHIIHHLDGRELLFVLPMSDQEVFHIVEEKVYRVIGGMLAGGFPIIEFVGGRKNKDSLITKLLSKQETIAAQIFDKLRFRIVTRTRDDIFPILQYLTKKLFPFNYVVPGQSINSIFSFKSYVEKTSLRPLLHDMQVHPSVGDDLTPSDNQFSAESYRIIHFVVDMPVRLPKRILDRAPAGATAFGNVIFVICEFQLVDRDTETHNELGDASHAKYKERQKKAVMRRLQLGGTGDAVGPAGGAAGSGGGSATSGDPRKRK
ncbi:MAG TPA: TIGR04552 family protein [Polyangiaceae bacterium]|nr:TIGR04552 family protein [Polyangiaceae bacterium]